jgi:hypothetical protein
MWLAAAFILLVRHDDALALARTILQGGAKLWGVRAA